MAKTAKKKATKKPAKRKPQLLTLAQLEDALILAESHDLRLQNLKKRLGEMRDDIRHTMEKKDLTLTFALEKRLQAQLVEQDRYTWIVDELKKAAAAAFDLLNRWAEEAAGGPEPGKHE